MWWDISQIQQERKKGKMQKQLISKIDFEWEKFYLDCMRTSKDNIFAKSKEISVKKEILNYLKEVDWLGQGQIIIQKALGVENVIESCYRYVTDYTKKNLQMNICEWIKTL